MESILQKILCVGVVAVLLLGLVGTGIAVPPQAHRGEAADNRVNGASQGQGRGEEEEEEWEVEEEEEELEDTGNGPIKAIYRAQGFALNDSSFHVLRISIAKVKNLQPLYVRGLLDADLSPAEIRERIREQRGEPSYQGYLRLGENDYRLVNITVDETNQTYDADIINQSNSVAMSRGNITVRIMDYEGVRIGEGTLTMTANGDYGGEYRVLLNIYPPFPRL